MLLRIDPDKPDQRRLSQVVEVLKSGGLIIYPTDTVYSLGCDLKNMASYERLCKLKNVKIKEANFSIVCSDLSHLSDFAASIPNPIFRLLKKALPGPYTFILKANSTVPKIYGYNKKTIGVRVPDQPLVQEIVKMLGNPIISASIKNDDDILEYITDPEELEYLYGDKVDLVIDGGPGKNIPSTVLDVSEGGEVIVVREGLGIVDLIEA